MSMPVSANISGFIARVSAKHAPAVATKATIAITAPGAKLRIIVDSLSFSLACGATAQTPLTVNLLSAATVKQSWVISAPANSSQTVVLTDVHFSMGLNEAVTLEFSAAGVAASLETVNVDGYVSA